MSDDNQKLTRQQIYQRIRDTGGKEAYIFKEMKRLGFWRGGEEQPALTEKFIEKRNKLTQELRALGKQQRLYEDPERALKELHKQRKKDALARREETRKAANQARYQRALNWHTLQKKAITFVGERWSHGLSNSAGDNASLNIHKLPVLDDSKALADSMGISINELRFLVYQKDVSHITHYQRFQMVKKTGGTRLISAPMPRLKRAQYWVLSNILDQVGLHDAAHGFVRERSIVTNATAHVGKDIVINLDLKDFFPTITYPRVKGMFQKLGYSEQIATLLSLLCTEADVQEVELDQQSWYVGNGSRTLPQGAPTSPAISNIICRRLDARLNGMADKLGFAYSRYADDITFSANGTDDATLQKLLWRTRGIIAGEGFIVHPEKTAIMRKHKQQSVTGVVVNQHLSIDRKALKRFRALLYQIDQTGPTGKHWSHRGVEKISDGEQSRKRDTDLFNVIEGYANFVAMVNPLKGISFQKQVALLKQKYGHQVKPLRMSELNSKLFRLSAAKGQPPRSQWWQAQVPAVPVLENTAAEITEISKTERVAKVNNTDNSRQQRSTDAAGSSDDYYSRRGGSSSSMGKSMMVMAGIVFLMLIIYSMN